jgi:hypothetical protein
VAGLTKAGSTSWINGSRSSKSYTEPFPNITEGAEHERALAFLSTLHPFCQRPYWLILDLAASLRACLPW